MYSWRGGLCHDDLHQAKGTRCYHTAPWGSGKPDQAHGTQSLSTGNVKPFSETNRDVAKVAAVPTMQHQSDIGTSDQGSFHAAGRLVHKASLNSRAHNLPFGMSPEDDGLAVAHNYNAPCLGNMALSPAQGAQSQLDSTIDATLLSHLLAQCTSNHACTSSASLHDNTTANMGWTLGTALQQDTSSAAAPMSMPELNDLLSQFPASQHKMLLDNLLASSNPQELLLVMQAAATGGTPAAQHALNSPFTARTLHQQGLAASTVSADSNQQLLQQLQLQASLAAQQAALSSSAPVAQGQFLQQCSPANQSLMQLLLQQQAAAVPVEEQQLQPTVLASMVAGPSAVAHSMAQLASRQQQHLVFGANSAMSGMWPAAADASTGLNSPVAAVLAQQQQQQAKLASLMAEAASLAAQQQQSTMLAAAAAAGQYNQLTAQLMASQLAASGPSTFGCLGHNPNHNLIASLGGVSGRHGNPRAAGVQHLVHAGPQQPVFGVADNGSVTAGKGRRSRAGYNTSRASSATIDISGVFGSTASSISSRPASLAGSNLDSSTDIAAAAAGVSIVDLCPSKFEDYWGAGDVVSSCGSTGSRAASDAASSWPSSGSSAGSLASSPVSSRAGSATAGSWQSDDEDSAAAATFAKLSLNASTSESGLGKLSDAVKAPNREQETANSNAGPAAAAIAPDRVRGCTAWFPGVRETRGDDSWYLELPNTCRLFVGNIGSWVDEDMLMAYFGKYGNVLDVQVMWNTKMLARGRRVNREFAFISYSSPLEAARAVHWLDGCRLVDLEKCKNGITVEYENGEGDSKK